MFDNIYIGAEHVREKCHISIVVKCMNVLRGQAFFFVCVFVCYMC